MPPSHFLKIYFNIILPSTPGSPKWPPSLTSPYQNPVCTFIFPHPCYIPPPPRLILLDLITRIIFGDEYRSLSSSLRSPLHSPLTSSLLGQNILVSTLFSNTLSLCSFLSVRNQVSHPYKKETGKIIVLYTLIFVCLGSNLEDERFSTE
jgi:hypothetical protein